MMSITKGIPLQCACSGTQIGQHAAHLQTPARAVRQSLEPSCSYKEQEQGRAVPQPLYVSRRACGLAVGAAALAWNARPAHAILSAPPGATLCVMTETRACCGSLSGKAVHKSALTHWFESQAPVCTRTGLMATTFSIRTRGRQSQCARG